jgi:hypothetical protein
MLVESILILLVTLIISLLITFLFAIKYMHVQQKEYNDQIIQNNLSLVEQTNKINFLWYEQIKIAIDDFQAMNYDWASFVQKQNKFWEDEINGVLDEVNEQDLNN